METKDPALTKTRIVDDNINARSSSEAANNSEQLDQKGTQTLQETVIGTRYVNDMEHGEHTHADIHHDDYNVMSSADDRENPVMMNKGTETFQESFVDSEHVNKGDDPARQPDRRDQRGSAFDDGINEHSVGSEAPQSNEVNDMNRYANIDNAQSRVLNPDDKD